MLEKLLTVFKIPVLRRKILLTLSLLAVYRMGFWIPLPMINQDALAETLKGMQGGGLGQALQIVQLFSASQIAMLH